MNKLSSKVLVSVLLVLMAAFVVASCNSSDSNEGENAAGKMSSEEKNEESAVEEMSSDNKNEVIDDAEDVFDSVTFISVGTQRLDMVYVCGGTFTMGCTDEQGGECLAWEKPAHKVTLSSYSIGKHEVTQGLWKEVMSDNPSEYKDDDNLPVENVSWEDCQEFIRKLNEITGQNFRLPTEAEWEYAARGGKRGNGNKFSGSNNIDDVAWCDDNSDRRTHLVGTKQPNELGIYDMSGNVWEWCSDKYGDYTADSQNNPTGPSSGTEYVNRGGSWDDLAGGCRVSRRSGNSTGYGNSSIGFRLVLSK